jgi:rhodanese-related sulfurtransferase
MLFSLKKIAGSKGPKTMATKALLVVLFLVSGFLLGWGIGKLGITSLSRYSLKLASSGNISANELIKALPKKNFTLINVHTPYEGEIEKTDMFITWDEIMASQERLPKDKSTPIVVYCKTGKMSASALETLKGLGYTNVRHLQGGWEAYEKANGKVLDLSKLPQEVLPNEGFTLPVSWEDIGPELIRLGVIDLNKFKEAVVLTEEQERILTQGGDIPVTINSANGQFVVDLLWALGLAQKSKVYDEGPLGKEYKNEQGNFASTSGWTLAKGAAVNYLNQHDLISLTEDQQEKVGEIAKNIYRPCCGNSTWFPDCNHGMAALAAIELMVSKGLSDEEIYKNVLSLNSFWFPDTYLMAATYFARQGTPWGSVDAQEVLGQSYSSAQGAAELYKKVGVLPYGSGAGGSCGA